MRQQLLEATGGLGRQTLQDVLQVSVRIVSVEFRGLDQAHDDGGALTGTKGTDKEPVRSTESDRTDSILDVVVVDGQIAIVEVTDQRGPAAQAVLDGFRRRRSIWDPSTSRPSS